MPRTLLLLFVTLLAVNCVPREARPSDQMLTRGANFLVGPFESIIYLQPRPLRSVENARNTWALYLNPLNSISLRFRGHDDFRDLILFGADHVLLGATDFKPRPGGGPAVFRFCLLSTIDGQRARIDGVLSGFSTTPGLPRGQIQQIVDADQGGPAVYVAHVGKDSVVMCDDEAKTRTFISALDLSSRDTKLATPFSAIPDRSNADVWAYRRGPRQDDEARRALDIGGAVGELGLSADVRSGSTAFRILTPVLTIENLSQILSPSGERVRKSTVDRGVEFTWQVQENSPSQERLLTVMGLFGFALSI